MASVELADDPSGTAEIRATTAESQSVLSVRVANPFAHFSIDSPHSWSIPLQYVYPAILALLFWTLLFRVADPLAL
jgi:hypothetical protein